MMSIITPLNSSYRRVIADTFRKACVLLDNQDIQGQTEYMTQAALDTLNYSLRLHKACQQIQAKFGDTSEMDFETLLEKLRIVEDRNPLFMDDMADHIHDSAKEMIINALFYLRSDCPQLKTIAQEYLEDHIAQYVPPERLPYLRDVLYMAKHCGFAASPGRYKEARQVYEFYVRDTQQQAAALFEEDTGLSDGFNAGLIEMESLEILDKPNGSNRAPVLAISLNLSGLAVLKMLDQRFPQSEIQKRYTQSIESHRDVSYAPMALIHY